MIFWRWWLVALRYRAVIVVAILGGSLGACTVDTVEHPSTSALSSSGTMVVPFPSKVSDRDTMVEREEGIYPPRIVAPPPTLPPGANLRDHIQDYFHPFDATELLQQFQTCTATDAREPEHLNMTCVGVYRDVNKHVESLGLPSLGHVEHAELTFSFEQHAESVVDADDECATTMDRVYSKTGELLILLQEPCTPDNKPYPGEWDERRSALSTIQIVDRGHGIATASGVVEFPTLTIKSFRSREAIEALMRHYGVKFAPLGPADS